MGKTNAEKKRRGGIYISNARKNGAVRKNRQAKACSRNFRTAYHKGGTVGSGKRKKIAFRLHQRGHSMGNEPGKRRTKSRRTRVRLVRGLLGSALNGQKSG